MTNWTPREGEFALLDRYGYIEGAVKVVALDPVTPRWALVVPVSQDVDPIPVTFADLRQHPLSTQRNVPEED